MGLLDLITGGSNRKAEDDLANILAQIQGIRTPSAEELQLSPLAQYTSTGELTPAMMEAAQAGPSAYDLEKLSTVPMSTMQEVLARQREIAASNGMTPQEQAGIARAEESANRNTAGQRGAIAQDFAGRGIPQSLISAALQNASAGQNAQQMHMDALNAQAGAANNGLTAMSNAGNLAGQMYGQEAGQANTIAAAQNALNQFNATNTQASNMANQANKQAANIYGTENRQGISNENVAGQHEVQKQNQIYAPQQSASLALQKANALSGVGRSQADQHTAQGQQEAAMFGGLLGAGATLGSSAIKTGRAQGGEIPEPLLPAENFVAGGAVSGIPRVPGDDYRNDTVAANLSPGEFVVPRTAMARPEIRNFLENNVPTPRPPSAHPSDIASVMRALSELRGNS